MIVQAGTPTSRAAAVALLIVLIVAAAALIGGPLATRYSDLEARLVEQRAMLARLQSRSRPAASPDDSRQALPAEAFLTGSSNAMRAAALQAKLVRLGEAGGLTIASARPLEPEVRDGLQFIGVELQLSATNEQLQDYLLAVETSKPVLFVRSLRVSTPALAADAQSERQLDVSIRIAGAVEQADG